MGDWEWMWGLINFAHPAPQFPKHSFEGRMEDVDGGGLINFAYTLSQFPKTSFGWRIWDGGMMSDHESRV